MCIDLNARKSDFLKKTKILLPRLKNLFRSSPLTAGYYFISIFTLFVYDPVSTSARSTILGPDTDFEK